MYDHKNYEKDVSATTFAEDVLDAVNADCLGGIVNSDEQVILVEKESKFQVEIRFWDGQRFLMTMQKLPDGSAYDDSGEPISRKLYKRKYQK